VTGLEIERLDEVPVARPRGDIDAANATRVREELGRCLAEGVDRLVLDLSETRYLDSAGLDMLFRLSERLRQRRITLLLVIPPTSNLARLAQIVALPDAVQVRDTLGQALDEPPPRAPQEPGAPQKCLCGE
jgi:anti-anti-sigma factor